MSSSNQTNFLNLVLPKYEKPEIKKASAMAQFLAIEGILCEGWGVVAKPVPIEYTSLKIGETKIKCQQAWGFDYKFVYKFEEESNE